MTIKRFPTLVIFLCFLILSAIVFITQQRLSSDEQEYTTYRYISELKHLDADFDKQILLIEGWHFINYDNINNAYERYESALASPPELPANLAAMLPNLRELVAIKFSLVERMKSSNAVLRNTLNYLPNSSLKTYREIEQAYSSGRIDRDTEQQLRQFLNYRIAEQLTSQLVLNTSQKILAAPNTPLPEDLEQLWQAQQKHLDQLERYQLTSYDLFTQVSNIATGERVLELSHQFSEYLLKQEQQEMSFNQWLVIYALIALGIFAMLIFILHRYHNQHSEQQNKAYSDSLTGLFNRRYLETQFPQLVSAAEQRDSQLGVMFIDLDGFKQVNDKLGHRAGDKLLQEIADTLIEALPEGDVITRFGGDEFVVICPSVERNKLASHAEQLVSLCSHQLAHRAETINVGASIGIALFPADGASSSELLQHADIAMYDAKQSGKACWRFYDQLEQRAH